MKRYGKLFEKIIHKQNLLVAHKNARRGKTKRKCVKRVDENLTDSINYIHDMLKSKAYTVSEYKTDTRVERGKERKIYKLPYYPDRIIQHAIMQVIEPILSKVYIKDTYQSIKGRGIHKAKNRIQGFLKDEINTKYTLKIDVKKFYPSVNNEIMKKLLRKKIKCKSTLHLLDSIIDSAKGLPIGNYLSQMLGNFYLSYFDHYMKEAFRCRYYIRYADDIVIFSSCKKDLKIKLEAIKDYLKRNLKLELKSNYQIFPTRKRGLDYLGFRFFEKFTLLRKSIKKSFLKIIRKIETRKPNPYYIYSLVSYMGWIKHSRSHNLLISKVKNKTIKRIKAISELYYVKNPLSKIRLRKPKKIMVKYHQPTLF